MPSRIYIVSLQVDLTSYDELCSVFEQERVDAVCHLASYGMSGRETTPQAEDLEG